ncbi:MAG TPA: nucleoside 2-deoxyribosyltransferase [Pirellulales bacterium]
MLIAPGQNLHRVYCAGALFNASERREMAEIAEALSAAGFETWLPQRDGLEFAQVQPFLDREGYDPVAVGHLVHEAVFALDAYQVLVNCGSLVLNLNGRTPDEGAVSEAAMAWAMGKPIVMYKADVRTLALSRDNPLVVGLTDFTVVPEISAIAPALKSAFVEQQPDEKRTVEVPRHVALPLQRGGRLWERLLALGAERSTPAVATALIEIFDPEKRRLTNRSGIV